MGPLIKLENYLDSYVAFLENQGDATVKANLQTTGGLDLLCFKEGLQMTLGEICCFYANHSEVIKNMLARGKQIP